MRVAVTGANGFIGSHLVEHLQDRGDEVYAVVRKTSSTANLEHRTVDFRHAAVSDVESLTAAFSGVDRVFHVAGITAGFSPEALNEVNAQGTANVMEAAEAAGVRRVVLVSSLEAAGPSHPELARQEHHEITSFTWYGRSKLGGEQAAYEAARRQKLEVVIVRPPLVYGPRDLDVLQMIQSANMRVIANPGFDDPWISAVHPHDLVRGIALAAEKGAALPVNGEGHVLAGEGAPAHERGEPTDPLGRGIYYVTDGGRHTIVGFGKLAAQILGKRAMTLRFPKPVASFAAWSSELVGRMRGRAPAFNRDKVRGAFATGWWADHGRATEELGYEPHMPLEKGLEETIAWLRERKVL